MYNFYKRDYMGTKMYTVEIISALLNSLFICAPVLKTIPHEWISRVGTYLTARVHSDSSENVNKLTVTRGKTHDILTGNEKHIFLSPRFFRHHVTPVCANNRYANRCAFRGE